MPRRMGDVVARGTYCSAGTAGGMRSGQLVEVKSRLYETGSRVSRGTSVSKGKRVAFSVVFGAILLVVTLVGVEVLSSYFVPPWPARALNPRQPTPQLTLAAPFRNQPWLAEADNSWGLRDSERTISKPPGAWRALRRRELHRIALHALVPAGGGAAACSRQRQDRGGQPRRRCDRHAELLLSHPRCRARAAVRRRAAVHLLGQRFRAARRGLLDPAVTG